MSATTAAYALASKSRHSLGGNGHDNDEGSDGSEVIVLGFSQRRDGLPDDDEDDITDDERGYQGMSVLLPPEHLLIYSHRSITFVH